MEDIVEIIVSAFPGLAGFFDTADIVVTAIPGGGVTVISIFILAGGLWLLRRYGYLKELTGGNRDDDNW